MSLICKVLEIGLLFVILKAFLVLEASFCDTNTFQLQKASIKSANERLNLFNVG